MTASTVSSTAITNKLAAQPTYNDVSYEQGRPFIKAGSIAVATTSIDETNDKIMLCEVPGNLRITSIKLYNDDLDSHVCPTLTFNVGLYKDVAADGTSATTVDSDAYASAIADCQAANTAGVEVAFEARNINVIGQTVAVDGAEAEHDSPRYIGLKVGTAAATAAAGDISWVVQGVRV